MWQPEKSRQWLNPFQFTAAWWLFWFALKCLGLFLLDLLVDFGLKLGKPRILPFRVKNPGVKGLVQLEWIDYTFLFVNSSIEYMFISNVCYLGYHTASVPYTLDSLSLLNTLPAFLLLFFFADGFYALAHQAMHWNIFYPYVHKHHHRQILPKRGYLDAGNEHPIEQVVGLATLWLSQQLVIRSTGLHAFTLLAHLVLYGVLALLNHTPYDVRFCIMGIPLFSYSVAAHEMHHRHPKCNMAQSFMMWDKLMGTFKEYSPPREGGKAQ